MRDTNCKNYVFWLDCASFPSRNFILYARRIFIFIICRIRYINFLSSRHTFFCLLSESTVDTVSAKQNCDLPIWQRQQHSLTKIKSYEKILPTNIRDPKTRTRTTHAYYHVFSLENIDTQQQQHQQQLRIELITLLLPKPTCTSPTLGYSYCCHLCYQCEKKTRTRTVKKQ